MRSEYLRLWFAHVMLDEVSHLEPALIILQHGAICKLCVASGTVFITRKSLGTERVPVDLFILLLIDCFDAVENPVKTELAFDVLLANADIHL